MSSSAFSRLRLVAAVSGVYDASVGVVMLAGRPLLAQLFHVSLPTPPIHADLNGIFLLSIACGYLIPYREPQSAGGRAYLWIMGPGLKGAGAAAFLLDYVDPAFPAVVPAVRDQRRRARAADPGRAPYFDIT